MGEVVDIPDIEVLPIEKTVEKRIVEVRDLIRVEDNPRQYLCDDCKERISSILIIEDRHNPRGTKYYLAAIINEEEWDIPFNPEHYRPGKKFGCIVCGLRLRLGDK